MVNRLLTSIAALALLSFPMLASALCEDALGSAKVRAFQAAVDRDSRENPSWFNHKLSEYPILVLDIANSSHCAALFVPNSGWSTIEIGFELDTDREFYGSVNNLKTANGDFEALEKFIATIATTRRLPIVYYWGWGKTGSKQLPPEFDQFESEILSPLASDLGDSVHEAFHFIVQDRSSGKMWTDFAGGVWDEYLSKCYLGNQEAAELHRQEVDALIEAYVAQDHSARNAAASEFLRFRRARNAVLPSFEYKDLATGKVEQLSCADQEARQELMEGVPQFIGNSLVLQQQLGTREQIARRVFLITHYYLDIFKGEDGIRPITSYYHTGAMMLQLIRDFDETGFLKTTEHISQRNSEVVLTDLFEERLQAALAR